MKLAKRRKAELVHARALSPSVRSLIFRTHDGSAIGHTAGQYVDIIVPTAGGLRYKRSYSVASAPDHAHPSVFEVAVTRVEGGPTSEALHALAPGAVVEIEGPDGGFGRRHHARRAPTLFVATGTGLAPLRAMLAEDVRVTDGPPLVLLFGCRTPRDILWGDELRSWAETIPRFKLHVTLSRATADWTGLVGHVQRHAHALARGLPDACAYVCGLSAMVDDVVQILESETGLPHASVHHEIYD